jgi:hypothetical protein
MEMNVGKKTKVIRISNHPTPIQIMTDQKQPENVKYWKYFDSIITYEARCTGEINSRIAMEKAAFKKRRTLFTNKLNLKEEASKVHSFVRC